MDITKQIIAVRTSKGVNQSELGKRLGLERGNYSRLEKRGSKLTIEQLSKIADALGVSLMDLLRWGEEVEIDKHAPQETQDREKRLAEEAVTMTLIKRQEELLNDYERIKSWLTFDIGIIIYDYADTLNLGTIKEDNQKVEGTLTLLTPDKPGKGRVITKEDLRTILEHLFDSNKAVYYLIHSLIEARMLKLDNEYIDTFIEFDKASDYKKFLKGTFTVTYVDKPSSYDIRLI